ncbi:hypothetical protein [Algoriphagus boritolerans]|uniref:Uncharacterized protein n=1 Tax=Algoriphagus boritolerans DSM 17298 = JCM 18970 TaxID=1120964 RepID=A0A1H5UIU0_9BACT|nr:hypothetical protein [Algoriphagus boritolerans]SEF74281.1 hypothetical protein SAMN03080598_01265 [Algoriphagus boritolerans DSM 17298 = JCM 18970]
MKRKLSVILTMFGVFFLSSLTMELTLEPENNDSVFSLFVTPGFSQGMGGGGEPSAYCGPLMGNEAGTRYCCANTNEYYCYAAGC